MRGVRPPPVWRAGARLPTPWVLPEAFEVYEDEVPIVIVTVAPVTEQEANVIRDRGVGAFLEHEVDLLDWRREPDFLR